MGSGPGGPALSSQTPLARLLAGRVDRAAQGLLSCLLTANGVTVRLTEVEAYGGLGNDEASHAYRGETLRNTVMFGPSGYAYVYFTYGMHWCLNVVCGPPGLASAVLLRAGEVVAGVDLARTRRPVAQSDAELTRGPARLCQALAIDRAANGAYLLDGGALRLAPALRRARPSEIDSGPRVGVTGAHDRGWRYWLAGDPTVSSYRRHTPRIRGG
jgi:DNA-3-methyladenine glycosylase